MKDAEIIARFIAQQAAIAADAKRQVEAAALDCLVALTSDAAELLYLDAARHAVHDRRSLDGEALDRRLSVEIEAIADRAALPPFDELKLDDAAVDGLIDRAYRERLRELISGAAMRGRA